MNPFKQYAGLRKEMYIIFWGRVVTNMGSMIFPLMTLILKNKMGYTASQAATMMIIISVIQLPCTMIGGKLADRFNKKYIICCCDLVTVIGYLICAFLPTGNLFLILLCVSGVFARVEWPSYDALVADLTKQEDRERAYSLNYLGANLGLVLAPTLGGLLFENHLPLAFVISSLATFSSTVLIFFFVKNITPEVDTSAAGKYEIARHDATTRQIFAGAPVLLLFVTCMGLVQAVYQVGFNFLVPLNMEVLYGAEGAILFGTLTSVNALVVIIGTPICTGALHKIHDTGKLMIGEALQMLGYVCFMVAQGQIPMYYVAMTVFTMGEVVSTLGQQPYLTRRVPASHRGRIAASNQVFTMIMQGICLQTVGNMAETMQMSRVWMLLVGAGIFNVCLLGVLRHRDRKHFTLLYETAEAEE